MAEVGSDLGVNEVVGGGGCEEEAVDGMKVGAGGPGFVKDVGLQ